MNTYWVYNDNEKRLEIYHKGTLVQTYDSEDAIGQTYVVYNESLFRFEIYANNILVRTYNFFDN